MTSLANEPREPAASAAGSASTELARLEGVTKRFPGVLALDNVDFDLREGEVHVLFGENGAGKSTLINVLAGTFPPDGGKFFYQGKEVHGLTPHRARVMGISPVFQEFSQVPDLTIEENLFLGHESSVAGVLKRGEMQRRSAALLEELGFNLNPSARVRDLSRAHQQMVEIAKALLHDVKLLILDEPTASLTESETTKLFALIERLKASGVGIIYVSHRMNEIKLLADRITVLRDGRKIDTVTADEVTESRLVELMTGRKIDVLFPKIDHRPGDVLLRLEHLTTRRGSVRDVSIEVRAGEVVGVAGLVGCGKSELARLVYGLEAIEAGKIEVEGKVWEQPSPSSALAQRICYFPSDRVAEGLALIRPVRENASIAALDQPNFSRAHFLRRGQEKNLIQSIVERLNLRPPSTEREVGNLSGGNRQKVMLARGLTRDIRVFLFDEPTVGIDVGAKTEVYEHVKALAEQGAAVLLISSELPEVLNLSNRLYVMHRGSLVAELQGDEISEEAVLACFFDDEEERARAAGGRSARG